MKKAILLLTISLSAIISTSIAQRVQGTIRNANAGATTNEVIVSIKPNQAFNALISNVVVAVQIPTSVGPRPSISFVNLLPNLFGNWTIVDSDQNDGFYTWGFNCIAPGAGNPDATAWTTAELDLLRISFVGAPIPAFTARLCHYLDGGTSGYALFYVETNLAAVNGGVLSDWGNLFYGTAPTNGATAAGNIGVPNALYSFTTAPNIVLPVRFLGFNVSKRNSDALLTWQIDNESSITDRYEIERSLNGRDFRKVATLQAKNNGNSRNSYDLTDANLTAISTSGIFYYRIKQLDKDGQFVYSDIKSLRINSRGMVIGVYPNPIKQFANVSIDSELDATAIITINDAAGKQLQNIQVPLFKGPNIKKLNMTNLASGTYVLKIQTGEEVQTFSVVKTY